MASEAFGETFTRAAHEPMRRARRITYVVSILVHAVAGIAAVAYSFWHVEELAPPRLTVTFMSAVAPPPPPPPPPPLGGGTGAPAARRHARVAATIPPPVMPPPRASAPEPTQPKPAPEAQPKPAVAVEPPAPSAHDLASSTVGAAGPVGAGVTEGAKGGLAGGVIGGTGTRASTPAPPVASKFLPPQMGAQLKLSGDDPVFPATLRTAGARYEVKARVCVSPAGTVDLVAIMKHANPALDGNVVAAVRSWRFRPLLANGAPVPFCYFANFDFSAG